MVHHHGMAPRSRVQPMLSHQHDQSPCTESPITSLRGITQHHHQQRLSFTKSQKRMIATLAIQTPFEDKRSRLRTLSSSSSTTRAAKSSTKYIWVHYTATFGDIQDPTKPQKQTITFLETTTRPTCKTRTLPTPTSMTSTLRAVFTSRKVQPRKLQTSIQDLHNFKATIGKSTLTGSTFASYTQDFTITLNPTTSTI